MKPDLNAVSSEYRPNGATEIENNLVLNWYCLLYTSRCV